MPLVDHLKAHKRIVFVICSVLLICLSYSNTLDSSFHFDDRPNIYENPDIQIEYLDSSSIFNTFFAHPGNPERFYRPVTYLSFGLNWFMGRDNVLGYHVVNIFIHILTYLFLYLLMTKLAHAPLLPSKNRQVYAGTALVAALLWAINPIQIQAVTYIVQRATSLAAMFFILGLLGYVSARLSAGSRRRLWAYLMVFSFIMALGSKEHAITFPAALVLVELFFFRDWFGALSVREKVISVSVLCISILCAVYLLLKLGVLGYGGRSFTLAERVLTEFRVLLFYLSQIIYPTPARLSLIHDVQISTSIITPPATILAILIVSLLVFGSIILRKKYPILGFSILFFFLAHSVESTILPLELIFEHRNYLPSVFLFWPVAVGGLLLYQRYGGSNFIRVFLLLVPSIYIGTLATWTWQRNAVWASEDTLWLDVASKYPELARSYQYLAMYSSERGEKEKALQLYKQSLQKKDQTPKRSRWLTHNNIGQIYLENGEYGKAQHHFELALDWMPNDAKIAYPNLIRAHIAQNNLEYAEQLADQALRLNPFDGFYLNMKGFFLLRSLNPEKAIPYFQAGLQTDFDRKTLLYNLAMTFVRSGAYDQAKELLEKLIEGYGNEFVLLLMQLENEIRNEDNAAISQAIRSLYLKFSAEEIAKGVKSKPTGLPFSKEIIDPVLKEYILDYK